MGARENDLNPDIYIGLTLPLGNSTTGFFEQTKTTIKQAQHNITNLLKTIPGERLGQPLYGSTLHHLLFEPMTDELDDRVKDEIKTSIDTWLPYITIKKINVGHPEGNPNQINVSIQFGLSFQPDATEQVSIDFEQFESAVQSGDVDNFSTF
jgi:phage baseplate assembly protein W